MKIAITSKKGGVTKSTQAKELALKYNLEVVDLDIDSHLKDTYSKLKVQKVNDLSFIPNLESCIYDFPAGDIFSKFPNTKEIISSCDLVIIPTLYAPESVDRAIDTYLKIKEFNTNILFLLAQTRDELALKDTTQYLEDILNEEVAIISIRHSLGMENAETKGVSIFDIAKDSPKLIQKKYKQGIIKDYEELFKLIEEVI